MAKQYQVQFGEKEPVILNGKEYTAGQAVELNETQEEFANLLKEAKIILVDVPENE